ncbi:carbohydrate kinase family protein, partial [Streptomyces goshikiensis]
RARSGSPPAGGGRPPPAPPPRLGCALATVVLQVVGTQTYKLAPADLLMSIEQTYGTDAARAFAPHLID